MSLPQGKLSVKPKCPLCHAALDGWTATEECEGPTDGDVSVCLYCAAMLVFTDGCTKFKPLPDTELAAHPAKAQLLKARAAVIKLMGHRN